MALDEMTTAVNQRAAELEPLLLAELDRAFAEQAEQAAQTLTAAADWPLHDGDELYNAAQLEQLIADALEQAKLELDTSVGQQIPGSPPGDYDTANLAARVAARHRGEVAAALLDGWNAGVSVDEMAERLSEVGQSSARLVAQTSLIGMSNAGSLAGALYAGAPVKQWLSAGDAHVRPSHREVDGDQVALSAVFGNGCRFPGDPFGPPQEVWNCRCTLIYPDPQALVRTASLADPAGTVNAVVSPHEVRSVVPQDGDEMRLQDLMHTAARRRASLVAASAPVLAEWTSPGIAYLDTKTGDGRALSGEIDWRTPPLPLMAQLEDAHGSMPVMQSRMAGGINQLAIDGNAVPASGVLDDTETGRSALEALQTGRYGVSIDLAVSEAEYVLSGLDEDVSAIILAAASGSTTLALGERTESWDGGSSLTEATFADGHFWRDPEGDPATKAAYKLPFASTAGGTLHAVWNGVTAAAAAIQGARGGVDIPEADMAAVRTRIEGYYAKARTTYDDDTIQPPWAARVASVAEEHGLAEPDDLVLPMSVDDELFVVTKGTIMGATIVPFAAFADARIVLTASGEGGYPEMIRLAPAAYLTVLQQRAISWRPRNTTTTVASIDGDGVLHYHGRRDDA